MANQEVIQHVTEGGLPSKPPKCPLRIYEQLLKPCFEFQAEDRPPFSAILRLLETLVTLEPSEASSEAGRPPSLSDYYFTASSAGTPSSWPASNSSDSGQERHVRHEPDYDLAETDSPTYMAANAIFAALDRQATCGADLAQLSADIQHQLPDGMQVTLEMDGIDLEPPAPSPPLDTPPSLLSLPPLSGWRSSEV